MTITYADVTVRTPDLHIDDPWYGSVDVWFGPTTVAVPAGTNAAEVAYFAGWHEKNDTTPLDLGLDTDGDWDEVWDALGADRTWLVAEVPSDDALVKS